MIDDDLVLEQSQSEKRNPIFIIGIGLFFIYTLNQLIGLTDQLIHFVGIRYSFEPIILLLLPSVLNVFITTLGILSMIRWVSKPKQNYKILFRNLLVFFAITIFGHLFVDVLINSLTTKEDIFNLAVLHEYQNQNFYLSLITPIILFSLDIVIAIILFSKGRRYSSKMFNPFYLFGYGLFFWLTLGGFWSVFEIIFRSSFNHSNYNVISLLWVIKTIKILFYPIVTFLLIRIKSIPAKSQYLLIGALTTYVASQVLGFIVPTLMTNKYFEYWQAAQAYENIFFTYHIGNYLIILLMVLVVYWVGNRYRAGG